MCRCIVLSTTTYVGVYRHDPEHAWQKRKILKLDPDKREVSLFCNVRVFILAH